MIDLRYADFTSADVEIHAYSIMGGQTILVPPEVNVDMHGSAVMGAFDHTVGGEGTPGAPMRDDPRLLAVGQRRHQAQEAQGRPELSACGAWRVR